jgi:hypothetical protein
MIVWTGHAQSSALKILRIELRDCSSGRKNWSISRNFLRVLARWRKLILSSPRVCFFFYRLWARIRTVCAGQIFVKFDMGNVYKNLSRKPKFVKVEAKCRAHYDESKVRFVTVNDIKSPQNLTTHEMMRHVGIKKKCFTFKKWRF